ncbi:MAG: RHS repeat-associated core domain-containing protein [Phycisphaerales bacterium]|nr:MAG: RHS repeat-associated core domain-containing protein [Phycisphaerales bacterium]
MVDEDDPWFWFCYDDRWRVVAVFRADDEDPKEVFVHHNAGLAGYGGSSYIDSVILRDRDTSAAWHEEAGDTRAERVYYAQNWRGDVSALLTDTGSMIEWVKYSAYGVPYALPAGDVDSNGSWSDQDEDLILERISVGTPYDVRFDANLDGTVDYDDPTHANSIAGGYQTLGRGVMSSPEVANRVGYAGYRYDPTFKGAGRTIYHVRHRVYDADVGRWTRRDPLGYVDGMSLYQYVRSMPVVFVDVWGLHVQPPNPMMGGGSPALGTILNDSVLSSSYDAINNIQSSLDDNCNGGTRRGHLLSGALGLGQGNDTGDTLRILGLSKLGYAVAIESTVDGLRLRNIDLTSNVLSGRQIGATFLTAGRMFGNIAGPVFDVHTLIDGVRRGDAHAAYSGGAGILIAGGFAFGNSMRSSMFKGAKGSWLGIGVGAAAGVIPAGMEVGNAVSRRRGKQNHCDFLEDMLDIQIDRFGNRLQYQLNWWLFGHNVRWVTQKTSEVWREIVWPCAIGRCELSIPSPCGR